MKAIFALCVLLLSGFAQAQVQYPYAGPAQRMCGPQPCYVYDQQERQARQVERYHRQHSDYVVNRAARAYPQPPVYYPPVSVQPVYPVYPAQSGFSIQFGYSSR